jgi:hypothetical protein
VIDGGVVELFALEGLDGKPPQLGDAHRLTLCRVVQDAGRVALIMRGFHRMR